MGGAPPRPAEDHPAGHTEAEQGRAAYAAREWLSAWELLSAADREQTLAADDLELLARSAYMLGRDDDYVAALERSHHAYLALGDALSAARCTWWIGHSFLFRGQGAPASGWFQRGRRLLEREPTATAAHGYLLFPAILECNSSADFSGAYDAANEAASLGVRFGDRDLAALGLMEKGHALVRQGRRDEGMPLVDETMVAAAAGELSPIVAGIVYCNTITFCHSVHDLKRAREWTAALTRWCDEQPEMVAHQGLCLVHRAQIRTLEGAWADALDELDAVSGPLTRGALNQLAIGKAAYARGEVHRLRGEFASAERAYQEASEQGCEPQPGLALLRLAEGKPAVAAAAIRRSAIETVVPAKRIGLLPAYVEIMLALGDREAAAAACRELAELARTQRTDVVDAMASQARGALALADGDAADALPALRHAWQFWTDLQAPYEAARVRVLLAEACLRLEDEDTAALELRCARDAFERLGAAADVQRLATESRPAGLSPRELEVLRLVAAGASNKDIAAELVLSERTVARHLQNIFVKLRVSSRTAASAYAFERRLI